ncbi:hypothetical protein HN51_011440, partial [Arachis hypogaea]
FDIHGFVNVHARTLDYILKEKFLDLNLLGCSALAEWNHEFALKIPNMGN